jgi:1-acyl-sn-glycerol-3-phosphate acyltransferase
MITNQGSTESAGFQQPERPIDTPELDSIADAEGNYVSTGTVPSFLAKQFPSVVFYARFIYIVVRNSLLAQRGRYGDAQWYQSSLDVLRSLESIGARIHISGLNVLSSVNGPAVLVANHMSTLETIFLPGIVQPYKDCTFVIKRGLIEYPVFKHLMLARSPIVVDRVNPREDLMRVLRQGADLLARGRSVIVFPQTTRTTFFDPAQFNSIGVKLAREAGVPIVPVAVRSDAWGNGRAIKEFGKIDPSVPVHFAFGNPIHVEGRGSAAHQAVITFISDHLRGWGLSIGAASSVPND